MARINLDANFFGDKRVDYLAQMTSESKLLTMGRLISIWFQCYHQITPYLNEWNINICAEWLGSNSYADYMEKANLAEKFEDKIYKISGVTERIIYLKERQEAGRKGGKKSSRKGVPNKVSKSKPQISSDSYTNILNSYNSILAKQGKVKEISNFSDAEIKKIDSLNLNFKFWEDLFLKCSESKFLLGNSDSNWFMDLDWILKEENIKKVMSGKYSKFSKKIDFKVIFGEKNG